jgi:hypothetical protein
VRRLNNTGVPTVYGSLSSSFRRFTANGSQSTRSRRFTVARSVEMPSSFVTSSSLLRHHQDREVVHRRTPRSLLLCCLSRHRRFRAAAPTSRGLYKLYQGISFFGRHGADGSAHKRARPGRCATITSDLPELSPWIKLPLKLRMKRRWPERQRLLVQRRRW